jgi:hypothetical protein
MLEGRDDPYVPPPPSDTRVADLLVTVCCAAVICCAFAAALHWPRHRYVVWLALAALTYASDSLGFDGVERILADITTLVLLLVAIMSALPWGAPYAHWLARVCARMPVAWTYAPTIVTLFADALIGMVVWIECCILILLAACVFVASLH